MDQSKPLGIVFDIQESLLAALGTDKWRLAGLDERSSVSSCYQSAKTRITHFLSVATVADTMQQTLIQNMAMELQATYPGGGSIRFLYVHVDFYPNGEPQTHWQHAFAPRGPSTPNTLCYDLEVEVFQRAD